MLWVVCRCQMPSLPTRAWAASMRVRRCPSLSNSKMRMPCNSPLERALATRQYAAFIFEPVVGAAGGALPAPEGYAKAVTEVCHRHGVLVICDEVIVEVD